MRNRLSLLILTAFLFFFYTGQTLPRENSTELYNSAAEIALRGDYDAAVKAFKKVIDVSPSYSLAYYGLGKVYLYMPDMTDEALLHLRFAVKFDKTLAKGYFYLGMAYMLKNRFKEAIKAFENAYKYDKSLIEALYNIGAMYDLLEMEHKAIQYFDDYIYQKEKKEGDILF